jgi:hyperosmotically inducible protein
LFNRTAEKAGDKMEKATETASAKEEEAGAYIDDAVITAEITADFLADPVLKVFQISGAVDSQETKDRSQAIASGVENVTSVQNELVIMAVE